MSKIFRLTCLSLCVIFSAMLPAFSFVRAQTASTPSADKSPTGKILDGLKATAGESGAGYDTKSDTANSLPILAGRTIGVALSLLGVLLLGYMLYAGFKWMTAEKDEDVKKAKEIIKNAVIGLVIIVLAYSISSWVLGQLSEKVLKGT